MSVAQILETGLAPGLTNQEIASLALAEDQAARRALARGERETFLEHRREADRLADMLK